LTIDGPNQLWVADITYVAIVEGFAYVAVILNAWSRRAVGYAISRSIDVRLTLAALKAAIELRKPAPGRVHHSDSQRITVIDFAGAMWGWGEIGIRGLSVNYRFPYQPFARCERDPVLGAAATTKFPLRTAPKRLGDIRHQSLRSWAVGN
jgi:hypothetical protein